MKVSRLNGRWRKGEKPELVNRFNSIKTRCRNPNAINYSRYGGKVIKCEWDTLKAFEADMLQPYLEHVAIHGRKNTQIDRIDPNGNYCKANCRWVTLQEQSENRRNIKLFTYNGKSQTLTAWSKELSINFSALYTRIYREKWPLERAFNPEKRINQYV